MNLDGFWAKSPALTSFIYPWEKESPPATIFRALHDTKYFFFRFDVIDTEILVNKDSNNKLAVLDSDRVEIFFKSDDEMNPYYGLELDPVGRVLDYKAAYYREFDYTWYWDGIRVRSQYTLNGYRVWGRIPLDSLRGYHLLKTNIIKAGLFRGKCIAGQDEEISFKWISWIKPDSEVPDFHIPSSFGELKLL